MRVISDEVVERFAASYFQRGKTYSPDLVRAAIEAALGDMVLVPMEPTSDMFDAIRNHSKKLDRFGLLGCDEVWRIMLAASQPPDAGEGREGGSHG